MFMGWETRYCQDSLLLKSGHDAVPVRVLILLLSSLSGSLSSQPLTGRVPSPHCPSHGAPRGSQLLAHQEAAGSVLRLRERLFITRGLLLHFFIGGRGGSRRPSSALQSDVWNGAPGVWARLHRCEHPLALLLRSSRRCCGVLSRGPRGALGKRPQFLFFCRGRRHLSHVRINKRHISLKKTTPSVLSLSVSLPLSFSFFGT